MIHQFESHPNKESFLQDLNQTEMINMFSEKSQKLIADMNNAEIFELCETSSKNQCTEYNLYWKTGIIYCSCGRNFNLRRDQKSSKRTSPMSSQSLAMLLRRIAVEVPNKDLLNDKECTTRLKKCCNKLVKRDMRIFIHT